MSNHIESPLIFLSAHVILNYNAISQFMDEVNA